MRGDKNSCVILVQDLFQTIREGGVCVKGGKKGERERLYKCRENLVRTLNARVNIYKLDLIKNKES